MTDYLLGAALIILLFFYIRGRKESSRVSEENRKILSTQKSKETKLGQIAERMAPFLEHFNHDPSKAQFLEQPIDYVIFEDDEIVFIEVKSGDAKLSTKQRRIKKLVGEGKIRWEEIRIK